MSNYINHHAQAYARQPSSSSHSAHYASSTAVAAASHAYPNQSTMPQQAYNANAYYAQQGYAQNGHVHPTSSAPPVTLPPIQQHNGYAAPNGHGHIPAAHSGYANPQLAYSGHAASPAPSAYNNGGSYAPSAYPGAPSNGGYDSRAPSRASSTHPSSPSPSMHSHSSSSTSTAASPTDRFPCPHCDKTFTRNFDRKRHMEIHVPGAAGSNRCRFCLRDYSRADSLKRHLDNGCDKSPGAPGGAQS